MGSWLSRLVRTTLLSWVIPSVPVHAEGLPPPPDLGTDRAVWPNDASFRNSDPWLVLHHDELRCMRPRVLILHFANDVTPERIRGHAEALIGAVREATRYHASREPSAEPFVQYQIAKIIDLRDPDETSRLAATSSSLLPRKEKRTRTDAVVDYGALFSERFARHLDYPDPRTPGRFLTLGELVNAGWIHELWFYAIHPPGEALPALETCELKQVYSDDFVPRDGSFLPAGNGHDSSMPWIGRSFRIAFFNPHRGPGCSLENFGHTLEAIAHSGAIPYYRRYFYEYAGFDMGSRFGLPIDSFYRLSYDRASGDRVVYTAPDRIELTVRGTTTVHSDVVVAGGNVHFPPGARWHYDLESPATVLSTIESFRTRKDPKSSDEPRMFSREAFAAFASIAPDCMGQWIVFWCQNMPGYKNRSLDDAGRPMKNWWPFLFY